MPKAATRRDHLENSVSALVDFWGNTGWRRDPLTDFSFGKQERALGDLHYAFRELRRGLRPAGRHRRKHWLILVAAAAATFAVVAYARRSHDDVDASDA